MTGASGAIFGVRLLEVLADTNIETHLIVSKWAQQTLEHETPYTIDILRNIASATYSIGDMGAKISSSISSKTDFLFCGTDPGSKLQKAKKLDIKIFYLDEVEQEVKN